MTPRTIPLFESSVTPASWNERMQPGEYAVHFSSRAEGSATSPECVVLSSLPEAEAYAQEQVAARPTLRCRIYDHQGFVGAPVREITGTEFKGERDLTPRVRRWTGGIFLFGGLGLTLLDWSTNFRLSWPAMIGTRMLVPGLILLATELLILLNARQKTLQQRKSSTL